MKKTSRLTMIAVVMLALVGAISMALPAFGQAASEARARFVHAIPGASAIDIYTDNTLTIANLQLGDASLYVHLPAGEHQVTVTQANVTTALWTQTITVDAGSAYTYVAATTDPLTFTQYKDDLAPLPLGKSRITAIHAIAGGPALDILLSDGRPVVSGLAYPQEYGTLDVPALVYQLAVVPTGEAVDKALVPAQPYALDSGTSYALLVYGTAARPQVKLLGAAGDSDTAGGSIRVAHGVVGADPVDIYLNNTLVAPSLAFGETSEYMAAPAGTYNVSVRQAGTQEDLGIGSVDLKEGDTVTALALDQGGITVQTYNDTVSTITSAQAGVNVINALPGSETVTVTAGDGAAVVSDVPPAQTGSGMVGPTAGDLTVTINGDAPTTKTLTTGSLYGGLYYDIYVAQGQDSPDAVLLGPASIALGPNSAPGSKSLDVATEAATAAPAQTEAAAAPTTDTSSEVVTAAPTEPPAQSTGEDLSPTARVLLDPGANLQLRQYPRSSALSLGLAPSGSTLIVHGRAGAPELLPGATPDPNATEFVDPVSQLAGGSDLDPSTTWLNVTYTTPDGSSIIAWVNALYVGVNGADGVPMPLKNLVTIPENRAGGVGTGVAPTAAPADNADTVIATVGGLDNGVNLQVRRTPTQEGESLTRVPNGTQLQFLGVNKDRTWVWVKFSTPDGSVTGWVNARYLVSYTYRGAGIDFGGLEQKNLLTVVDDSQRGDVGGTIEAPAAPTVDPLKNAIVATVDVNEGVSLQLRRKANENAESLGLIPNATQVVVRGRTEDGAWLWVSYQEQTGWVSARYVHLTFNGRPYELGQVPLYQSPLTEAQINSTMTATLMPQPSASATERVYTMEIQNDVGMTRQPGSDGDGMPVLSKGTIVQYIFFSNDLQFVMVKAPDGTTGWIPSFDAMFHDGQPF